MLRRLVGLSVLVIAAPLFAQEAAKDKSAWRGETALGYSKESGNTNETKVNFSQKVIYDARPWLNTLTLSGKGSTTEVAMADGSTTDQHTSEAYYLTEQLDHFFGGSSSYAFARATWEKDRFNGYEQQMTGVLGYGNELFSNDVINFKVEVGIGQRSDELSEPLTDSEGTAYVAGDKIDETLAYFSDQFVWKMSEGAEFGQSLNVEYADINTVSRFKVYVKAQLISSVAMKVSYEIKHQEIVAADKDKRDEILMASLLYSF